MAFRLSADDEHTLLCFSGPTLPSTSIARWIVISPPTMSVHGAPRSSLPRGAAWQSMVGERSDALGREMALWRTLLD
jgi:hypothetical protein